MFFSATFQALHEADIERLRRMAAEGDPEAFSALWRALSRQGFSDLVPVSAALRSAPVDAVWPAIRDLGSLADDALALAYHDAGGLSENIVKGMHSVVLKAFFARARPAATHLARYLNITGAGTLADIEPIAEGEYGAIRAPLALTTVGEMTLFDNTPHVYEHAVIGLQLRLLDNYRLGYRTHPLRGAERLAKEAYASGQSSATSLQALSELASSLYNSLGSMAHLWETLQ